MMTLFKILYVLNFIALVYYHHPNNLMALIFMSGMYTFLLKTKINGKRKSKNI